MNLLKNATRKLLLQNLPTLSIPKQGYEINDDYINIVNFTKNNCMIQIENLYHTKELIKDKTVLKRYFSDEIVEEFNYLPFIQLGIEYLLEHAEFEDAQKGKIILTKHISKIEKKERKLSYETTMP